MSQGFDEQRLARITPFLQHHYVDSGAIPGTLTMIWRRGALAHLSMSGMIDLERGTPMREDAIFRIYSMTKPITAVALLVLMEEGHIGLDDPVANYVPGFANVGVFAGGSEGGFETMPVQRPMTVKDLLRHTSGLTYGFMQRTPVDAVYRKHLVAEPNQPGGMAGLLSTLEAVPLEFSPGTQWNYSVGLDVIGALVEIVSGQRFGAFLQERILGPLGMADTDFVVPKEKKDRFSSCYYIKDGKLELQDDGQSSTYAVAPRLESGGGGLAGTAADYMRFSRMLLHGGELDGVRILSPKTVALMTMNHLPGRREMTEMMPNTSMFNEAGYSGVGFGLGVGVTQNIPSTGLPGSEGEFFWGGAASTYFFVDPKEDMAVVFMTQALGVPERVRLRRDLRTLIYGAMAESCA